MTAEPVYAPAGLRPKWWQIPRLSWVTARAFHDQRRPNRLASVWALPPAALVYLPLLAGARLRGHVAASRDGTGVIVAWTGRRDRLAVIGLQLATATVMLAAFNLVTDLALAAVTTLPGAIAAAGALLGLLTLTLLPAMAEARAMLRRRRQAAAASAERYTAQLRRSGHTAWAIGPWAAWPPGRRAGTTLIDQLLPHTSRDVWLVAVARNPHIAAALDARGFRAPEGGGLLRVRPPTGHTPPPT